VEERPPIWRVAAHILNKRSRPADKGCSRGLVFGRGAINFHRYKNDRVSDLIYLLRAWTDPLIQMDLQEMGWRGRGYGLDGTGSG